MNEQAFLEKVTTHPDDPTYYLVLADWLEENGAQDRALLLRLRTGLLTTCCEPNFHPERHGYEADMVRLLCQGVEPPVFQQAVPLDLFLDMHFHFISPGSFLMGSPRNDPHHLPDEHRHPVNLTKGFFLGVHPVTLEQWHAVMGNTRGVEASGPKHPVTRVSWHDCQRFIARLREKDGRSFRLPTEAEWESACRAGTTTHYFYGNTLTNNVANFMGNRDIPTGTLPVGSFPPNAWGLYDMHGNIREWCDPDTSFHSRSSAIHPAGPPESETRILRGGSWQHYAHDCRCACRTDFDPGRRSDMNGFRLAYCLE